MKKILIWLSLVLPGLLFVSCGKDDDELQKSTEDDFLVFGHFYGECAGEYCVEIFKIEDAKVYEDTDDQYPGTTTFYEGDFSVELSDTSYNLVFDLIEDFPDDLWSEAEKVIGQPDAGDWGGLYIEYKKGDDHDYWVLDQMKPNVPATYHEFIDSINAKIELLQP